MPPVKGFIVWTIIKIIKIIRDATFLMFSNVVAIPGVVLWAAAVVEVVGQPGTRVAVDC